MTYAVIKWVFDFKEPRVTVNHVTQDSAYKLPHHPLELVPIENCLKPFFVIISCYFNNKNGLGLLEIDGNCYGLNYYPQIHMLQTSCSTCGT